MKPEITVTAIAIAIIRKKRRSLARPAYLAAAVFVVAILPPPPVDAQRRDGELNKAIGQATESGVALPTRVKLTP